VDAIKETLANDEQKVGADIVKRALTYPIKLIANNAGVNGSVVMQKVIESGDPNYGYNAAIDTYQVPGARLPPARSCCPGCCLSAPGLGLGLGLGLPAGGALPRLLVPHRLQPTHPSARLHRPLPLDLPSNPHPSPPPSLQDLMAAGIIDPTKVIRCTLENACSVAKTFLLADVVVTEIPERQPAAAAAGGPSDYDY
jgi:hypothetical protein